MSLRPKEAAVDVSDGKSRLEHVLWAGLNKQMSGLGLDELEERGDDTAPKAAKKSKASEARVNPIPARPSRSERAAARRGADDSDPPAPPIAKPKRAPRTKKEVVAEEPPAPPAPPPQLGAVAVDVGPVVPELPPEPTEPGRYAQFLDRANSARAYAAGLRDDLFTALGRGTGATNAKLQEVAGAARTRIERQRDRAAQGGVTREELRAQLPASAQLEFDETVKAFEQMFTPETVSLQEKLALALDKPENAYLKANDDATQAERAYRINEFVDAMIKVHGGNLQHVGGTVQQDLHGCAIEAVCSCEDPVILLVLYLGTEEPTRNPTIQAKLDYARRMLEYCEPEEKRAIQDGSAIQRSQNWFLKRVRRVWYSLLRRPPNFVDLERWCQQMDTLLVMGTTNKQALMLHELLPRYSKSFKSLNMALASGEPSGVPARAADAPLAAASAPDKPLSHVVDGAQPHTQSATIGDQATNLGFGPVYITTDEDGEFKVANGASKGYVAMAVRDKLYRFWSLCMVHLENSSDNTGTDLQEFLELTVEDMERETGDGGPRRNLLVGREKKVKYWQYVGAQILSDELPLQPLARRFAEEIAKVFNGVRRGDPTTGNTVPTPAITTFLDTNSRLGAAARMGAARPPGAEGSLERTTAKEENRDTIIDYMLIATYAISWAPNGGNDLEYSWFGQSAAAPVAFAAMQLAMANEGDGRWATRRVGAAGQLNPARQRMSSDFEKRLRAQNEKNERLQMKLRQANQRQNHLAARRARQAQAGHVRGWTSSIARMYDVYDKFSVVPGVVPYSGAINETIIRYTINAAVWGMLTLTQAVFTNVARVLLMILRGPIGLGLASTFGAPATLILAAIWYSVYLYIFYLEIRALAEGQWRRTLIGWPFMAAERFRNWWIGYNPDDADDI